MSVSPRAGRRAFVALFPLGLAALIPLAGCAKPAAAPTEVATSPASAEPPPEGLVIGGCEDVPISSGEVLDLPLVEELTTQNVDLIVPGGAAAGGPADATMLLGLSPYPSDAKPKAADRVNAEEYGRVVDNPFLSAAANPLSTFSADVNSASYSNVRRFLTQNRHFPPTDAVLAAEFVNTFEYAYPQPTGTDPVSFTLNIGPCPWQPTHHLARVGVKAKSLDPAKMPARNFVFLVDVSGSMDKPNRLPLVQKSLLLLADQLTANDFVSIVTYASGTGVPLPATPGNEKDTIRAAIRGLRAGGGTNGGAGIDLAYRQAAAHFITGGENRVILCTDGDFNLGQTSEQDLVRQIEDKRKTGVFLSVVGFGMGNLKDKKMKEIANHGNGFHAYIDTEKEARRLFVEQGGSLVTVAKDVKLQVEFNPKLVASYRLIGYENRLLSAEDFKDDKKDAGEMGSGHAVTALYEIVPAGKDAPPAGDWFTAKMRYKAPDSETSAEVTKALPAAAFAAELPGDVRFAAAAAEFAMLLRDSKDRGAASYEGVIAAAEPLAAADPHGHRAEFVELVKIAKKLAAVAPAPRLLVLP